MVKATWWLERAIRMNEQRRHTPRGLQLVLAVRPGREAEVAAAARRAGARVLGTVTGAVLVDVPDPGYIDALARIPGVESVAYNAPVAPMETYLEKLVMTVASVMDPLLRKLTPSELHALGIKAFVDRETVARALLAPKLPLLGAPPFMSRELLGSYKIIPTSESRRFLGVPSGATVSTKVAVIDSGVSPNQALRKFVMQYVLAAEPPGDYMAHGEWCTSAAFGNAWPLTLHGGLEPVVDASHVAHYKVFTAFGPTSTFQVMKAMELAAKHGAKVVSMSLGGPLQDRVDKQPDARSACIYSRMYGTVYVVAAGNDGPGEFTISSPGASPCAVTVASISLTDGEAAWWSSRGPQGGYYKEHPDDLQEDIAKYGEAFMLKPTLHAPGGGRARKNAEPDEVIYSGCTGWFELLAPYDHTPGDGMCGMHGTSQATPHAAGLVAYLVDRGMVSSYADVARRAAGHRGAHDTALGWAPARIDVLAG